MNKKTIILIASLFLGSITGIFFKNFSYTIKPLGTLFLNLMFTLVVPLVFFTISTAIMKNKKKSKLLLSKTIIYFFLTSLVATLIMLFVSLIFKPGTNVILNEAIEMIEKPNILEKIVTAISVGDFKDLLSKSNMLALIIFACLFGLSTKSERLIKNFNDITNTLLKVIEKIMVYAPIGIYAFMASNIAEYGNELFVSYIYIFILYTIVSILYFLIINSLYAYRYNKIEGIKTYFLNIIPSLSTSLATQSSLATLPTNIKVANDMKLNKEVTDLSLPLGATMNMHGSCMASVIKIMFLFTIFNIEILTPLNIIALIFVSILSGVVMSGIPGGGLLGEALIVSLFGFPTQALGYLATIGYVVDAPATMINATTDLSVSMLIEKP